MSNSMPNDYFSFMSDKGKQTTLKPNAGPGVTQPLTKKSVANPDTIEFVEEISEMEVIEGTATDTMIERLFTRWGDGR